MSIHRRFAPIGVRFEPEQVAAFTGIYNRINNYVDQILKLHKILAEAKTPHEKESIQRQIDAADKQIDQLVYQLYGLTDEEIRIVEEATAPAKS
jgi:hypothetical protein